MNTYELSYLTDAAVIDRNLMELDLVATDTVWIDILKLLRIHHCTAFDPCTATSYQVS
jgi:hypothetical protein